MVPVAALLDSVTYYLQTAGFDSDQVIELRLLQMLEEDKI
jgi:glutamate formiminotransferase